MEENLNEPLYPSLIQRIQSSFIDLGILFVLMYCISVLLDYFSAPESLRAILFIFIFFLYEPLTQTLGGTLGNRIMKINVRKSYDESKKINFLQAIVRLVIKVLLGWLSFITIHSDYRKRAIHDMVAGTIMTNK